MKLLKIIALLLVSSSSMAAIMVPTEYLNPEWVAAGRVPDLDNLGFTQEIAAGGAWVWDYTVTTGDTSGWFGFETQTTRADSLELWAIEEDIPPYSISNPNYIELLALGESTFDPTTGLYTHLLQGFLDDQSDASGWAVQLASGDGFTLDFLAPGPCCSSEGPWLLRPEGAETLNTWRERNADVSEPATLALFMLGLAGALGLKRKAIK